MVRLLLAVAMAVAVTSSSAQAASRHLCPRSDKHTFRSHRQGATRALVPSGVTGVLLCRYTGVDEPADQRFVLAASRSIDRRASAHRLARQLDALKPPPRNAPPIGCSADFGTRVIAFFHYRHGPDNPVTVPVSGCGGASNGHVLRWTLSPFGSRLEARLLSLTG